MLQGMLDTSDKEFMAQKASQSFFWAWLYRILIYRLFNELDRKNQVEVIGELEAMIQDPAP